MANQKPLEEFSGKQALSDQRCHNCCRQANIRKVVQLGLAADAAGPALFAWDSALPAGDTRYTKSLEAGVPGSAPAGAFVASFIAMMFKDGLLKIREKQLLEQAATTMRANYRVAASGNIFSLFVILNAVLPEVEVLETEATELQGLEFAFKANIGPRLEPEEIVFTNPSSPSRTRMLNALYNPARPISGYFETGINVEETRAAAQEQAQEISRAGNKDCSTCIKESLWNQTGPRRRFVGRFRARF